MVEPGGRRVAALVHDPALREDPHVLNAVAAAAELALENQRLAADVRARLAKVRASRSRIVAAGDAERQHLERDLHCMRCALPPAACQTDHAQARRRETR